MTDKLKYEIWDAAIEGSIEWRMSRITYFDLRQSFFDATLPPSIGSGRNQLLLFGIPVRIDDQFGRGIIVGIGKDGEEHTIDAESFCVNLDPEPPPAPPVQPTLNMYPGWDRPNPLWRFILWIIDWLNGERQEKIKGTFDFSKPKHTTEQMATIEELFEGYEDEMPEPPPAPDKPCRDDTKVILCNRIWR